MTKHLLISAAAAALIASGGFAAAQGAGDHAGRMENGQGASHASEAGASHQGGATQHNPSADRAQTRASNGNGSDRGDSARSAQRDPSASQGERAGKHQAQDTQKGRDGDKKAAMNRDGAGKTDKDSTKSAQNRNSHDAKTGRSAAEDRGAGNPDRNGTTRDRADRNGSDRNGADRDRSTASRDGRDGDTRVSSSERARISETIRSQHVENIRNVDFDVRVGGVVPGRYHFNPLPSTIVSILPQYRGYDYLVANDEIVIVEPHSHRIVYTMSEGRSAAIDRPSTSCR